MSFPTGWTTSDGLPTTLVVRDPQHAKWHNAVNAKVNQLNAAMPTYVDSDGDVLPFFANGIVMSSPDGTLWRITVDNTGNLMRLEL